MYQKFFKRLLDLVLSLILFIISIPFMILMFFLIWCFIGFPIFTQKRPGLNGKIFTLYKFKTLYDAKKNLSEKKRQSKLGNFFRKTGLDELPQLINIFKNDMSFVGPRPLLVEYLNKYSNFEKKRHLVKPGITGLAQVNPDASGVKIWKKSIKLDVYYAANVSFIVDIKIIYKTVELVLFKKKQYKDFKKFNE
jgi:undecaprenyl phosphate N,N'-diacetylbacillosamine 1-phosphate transferase|tara:strand:- start:16 stop:594 length:579 start_codon:yes stop_codon:yes gene_type:complete